MNDHLYRITQFTAYFFTYMINISSKNWASSENFLYTLGNWSPEKWSDVLKIRLLGTDSQVVSCSWPQAFFSAHWATSTDNLRIYKGAEGSI